MANFVLLDTMPFPRIRSPKYLKAIKPAYADACQAAPHIKGDFGGFGARMLHLTISKQQASVSPS